MEQSIDFVNYDEKFLELSFQWLRDPEIKRLTLSPDIKKEEQLDWYKNLEGRNDYKIWGVLYNGERIGAVGLKNIDYINKSAEYFGYIGEKDKWGHGIGTAMLEYAISEAKKIGLHNVSLQVSQENIRAIKLYKKLGFVDVGGYVKKGIDMLTLQLNMK